MSMKKSCLSLVFCAMVSFGSLQAIADSDHPMDDAMITTKVKAKMLTDKRVSALKIEVTTEDGVVHLAGNVKTDNEASAAIEAVNSTEGVVDVDISDLKVKSSKTPFADTAVTAKVKGTFIREKLFGEKSIGVTNIHVETKEEVVYLSGKADSEDQAKNAEKLAKSVKGVKEVKSSIKVKK